MEFLKNLQVCWYLLDFRAIQYHNIWFLEFLNFCLNVFFKQS